MTLTPVWKRAVRWALIVLIASGVAALVSIVIAHYGASVFRAFSGAIPA